MRRWLALVIVGLLGVFLGGAGVWIVTRSDDVPGEVRTACRLVSEAYSSASRKADAFNARDGEANLVHPWAPADAWEDSDQVELEDAVTALQPIEKEGTSEWWPLAVTIDNAARVLDPSNPSDRVTANAALESAAAACVGRNR